MGLRERAVSIVLPLLLLLAAPLVAQAHPGRLDKDGCHAVHTKFVYKSGKVAEPGTSHCHRGLGKAKLDGSEVLTDGQQQVERDDKGVPLALDPDRALTADEINAAIRELGCAALPVFRDGDAVSPRQVSDVMACAAKGQPSETTVLTIKRMRWQRGERW